MVIVPRRAVLTLASSLLLHDQGYRGRCLMDQCARGADHRDAIGARLSALLLAAVPPPPLAFPPPLLPYSTAGGKHDSHQKQSEQKCLRRELCSFYPTPRVGNSASPDSASHKA